MELVSLDRHAFLAFDLAGDGKLLTTLQSADRRDDASQVSKGLFHRLPYAPIRNGLVTSFRDMERNQLVLVLEVITASTMVSDQRLVVVQHYILPVDLDEARRLHDVEEQRLNDLVVDLDDLLGKSVPLGSLYGQNPVPRLINFVCHRCS